MIEIIWHHVKACFRDIRASRIGDCEVYDRPGHKGQLFTGNGRKEWRLR